MVTARIKDLFMIRPKWKIIIILRSLIKERRKNQEE